MMAALSRAGFLILHRLLTRDGAAIVSETKERSGYFDPPLIKTYWSAVVCRTCQRPLPAEPVNWRAVFRLEESGFLRDPLHHGAYYNLSCITPSGAAAYNAIAVSSRGKQWLQRAAVHP